jgi:type IV pilus assembly protein PilV
MRMARITPRSNGRSSSQHGVVLLDALVAIVIFSIGIIGMVALQAQSKQLSSGANYRLNAAMLADQVIAQMWGSDPTALAANFQTGGPSYTTWLNTVSCDGVAAATSTSAPAAACLPGVAANPPTINLVQQTITGSSNTEYQVTVTINWQAPNDTAPHQYVSVTDIGN